MSVLVVVVSTSVTREMCPLALMPKLAKFAGKA
jgi:hypothetical protein